MTSRTLKIPFLIIKSFWAKTLNLYCSILIIKFSMIFIWTSSTISHLIHNINFFIFYPAKIVYRRALNLNERVYLISGVINSFIYFIVNCIVKKNTVWSIGTIIVLCNLVKINNLKNFEKARISGWLVIISAEIIYAKLYFCYQRVFVSSYSIILYLNIISKKKNNWY